MRRGRASTH
ncbi:hypothetical protein YPPY102_2626, partial [Yersinia pestis PY-102]